MAARWPQDANLSPTWSHSGGLREAKNLHFPKLFLCFSISRFIALRSQKIAPDGPRWLHKGPKLAPSWPQDGPKTASRRSPDGSKSHLQRIVTHLILTFVMTTPAEASKCLQEAPKIAPGAAQGAPRGPQGAPKRPPEAPKRPPKAPRGLQEAPQRPQRGHVFIVKMSISCGRGCISHSSYHVAGNMSPLGRSRGPALRA